MIAGGAAGGCDLPLIVPAILAVLVFRFFCCLVRRPHR
jgi:hypothetical protein